MAFERRKFLVLGAASAVELLIAACGGVKSEPGDPSKNKPVAAAPTPFVRPQLQENSTPNPAVAELARKLQASSRHEINPNSDETLKYEHWAEFDGGIIINLFPGLEITIDGKNLYDHYNNPLLGMKSILGERLILLLLPTETTEDTQRYRANFQKLEVNKYLDQSKQPRNTLNTVNALAVGKLVRDDAMHSIIRPELRPNANRLASLGGDLTIGWAANMIAVASKPLPDDQKVKWTQGIESLIRQKPVFKSPSLN